MDDREFTTLLAGQRKELATLRTRALDLRQQAGDSPAASLAGALAQAVDPVISKLFPTTHGRGALLPADLPQTLDAVVEAQEKTTDSARGWRRLLRDSSLSDASRVHVEEFAELQLTIQARLDHLEGILRRWLDRSASGPR